MTGNHPNRVDIVNSFFMCWVIFFFYGAMWRLLDPFHNLFLLKLYLLTNHIILLLGYFTGLVDKFAYPGTANQ